MNLTPTQAHYVLTRLLEEGRVRAHLVASTLDARDREIKSLRERLATLESLGGPARRGRRSAGAATRKRKLSPQVRALRRQQGKYMGFVRRLKPAQKAKVRAVRETKGLPAAIRLASSMAGRSA